MPKPELYLSAVTKPEAVTVEVPTSPATVTPLFVVVNRAVPL